jgi:hypothetical protein
MTQLCNFNPGRLTANGDLPSRLPSRKSSNVKHTLYDPATLIVILELRNKLAAVREIRKPDLYMHGLLVLLLQRGRSCSR